jgi:hypothetical protein
MNLNLLLFPTLLLGFFLFAVEPYFGKKKRSRFAWRMLITFELLAGIPAVLYIIFYLHFFDGALWFYKLRTFTGSELAAAGLGLLAGRIHRRMADSTMVRRLLIPAMLVFLLLIPHIKPLIAPLDYKQLRNNRVDGVCLQITSSTCGPACAATLLEQSGTFVSEKELAKECFTYQGGTEVWYLARALVRRGFVVDYQMKRSEQTTLPCPAIAGVTLEGGFGHFIAILEETPDFYIIADPMKGKLALPKNNIANHYRFTGFFLHIKPPSSL